MTHLDPPHIGTPARPEHLEIDRAVGRTSSLGARLARFLYPAPAKRTVGGIFRWWEKRRLSFNLIVGAGSAVSLLAHGGLNWFQGFPWSGAWPPLLPALLVVNACYTLGPLTESLLYKIWGRDVLPVGPHLLRAGLTLSVGITLVLPMIAFGIRLAVALVNGVLGGGFP